jgi:hypothetical protein
VSLSTDEVWYSLVEQTYPELEKSQWQTLKMFAASDWYNNADTDLSKLFDQYVTVKTLMQKGTNE